MCISNFTDCFTSEHIRRQISDRYRVSKGDCDNFVSLGRPSPSEVVMDKPLKVHQRFRTLPWREGILCMNFKGNKEFKLILKKYLIEFNLERISSTE